MDRKIRIAELKPVRHSVAPNFSETTKALVAKAPASLLVEEAAEGVADGVQVGRDVKAPDLGIVARVADDGHRSPLQKPVEAPKELGGACPAGEGNDVHEAVS